MKKNGLLLVNDFNDCTSQQLINLRKMIYESKIILTIIEVIL